jgi:hypothetical protein
MMSDQGFDGRTVIIRGTNGEIIISSRFKSDTIKDMAKIAKEMYAKAEIVNPEHSYLG